MPHRPSPFGTDVFNLQELLLRAERRLAVIDSLTPVNFFAESEKVRESCRRGVVRLPEYEYAGPRARSSQADEADYILDAAASGLTTRRMRDALGEVRAALLDARLLELRLDVELVRACGTHLVLELGVRRMSFLPREVQAAETTADLWLTDPGRAAPEGELQSLASQLAQMARDSAGPEVRVVERALTTKAAVGGAFLYVAEGALASAGEASRIWAHEVGGHLLPRLRARNAPPPFAIGTADCDADEEGRAILLEERSGELSSNRRRELAVRFQVASATRQGESTLREKVSMLLENDVSPDLVADVLARVLRGGGLAREFVYLPAYLRVKQALTERPELEALMEQGRISVSGARALSASL